MGVENPASGKDFIAALDQLIADVECGELKMSGEGITREELKKYPAKVHEVMGGDITADPLPLSDEDYLTIFENASDSEKNQSLTKKVLASGHKTLVEHISFNLAFVNVPGR